MKRLISILALGSVVSGCAMTNPLGEGMAFSGTPKALRAYLDGQNALITNGKASPDKDTAAWRTRRHQDTEETKRAYAPSFLDGLFGVNKTVSQDQQPDTESAQAVGSGAL